MMLATATKSQWGVANATFQRANVLPELVNVPAAARSVPARSVPAREIEKRSRLDEAVLSN
jgi:hypothetical protein